MEPSQKFGTATPKAAMPLAQLPMNPPRFEAATTARGKPRRSPKAVAAIASPSVTGRRSRSASMTGWPVRSEVPRSPRAARASQRPYWTYSGRLRPMRSRTAASFSSVTFSRPTSATAGSPGSSRTSEKTRDVVSSTSGMTARSRRRRKAPTSAARAEPDPPEGGLAEEVWLVTLHAGRHGLEHRGDVERHVHRLLLDDLVDLLVERAALLELVDALGLVHQLLEPRHLVLAGIVKARAVEHAADGLIGIGSARPPVVGRHELLAPAIAL